jgi:hypothetical protein
MGHADASGLHAFLRSVGRASAVLIFLICVSASTAIASWADRGVAVDVGHVDVPEALLPGESYRLDPIGVRNPGGISSSYVMALDSVASERSHPPAEWFEFRPETFELDPGAEERVEVTIQLPEETDSDEYEALISAQLAGEGEGPRVGAAAAVQLTFSVDAGPDPWEMPWWAWWVIAGLAASLLLVLTARWVRARYRFQIQRR